MHRESARPTYNLEAEDDQLSTESGPLSWSIRRAIALLDEAIDRMGDQWPGQLGSMPARQKVRAVLWTRLGYAIVGDVGLLTFTIR